LDALAAHDIEQIIADNPGPFTLRGTNTWLVGRDPCYVVDPGPALAAHRERILSDARDRGGIAGVAITHDHADHVDGLVELLVEAGTPPVAAVRHPADVTLSDGDTFGPFTVVATPGHAPDHVAFVAGRACFTGDAVLGEGSVFVAGDLAGYLDGLQRLRELDLAVLCPGHGEPIWDADGKLRQYIEHRLDRERRLLAALDRGLSDEDELLAAAWDDAPPHLRPFAAVSLRAHLEKLRAEGRA
jgi:glyoxylase-like metal-dependent hydrolase (beta-lactamase superfamily II)